MKSDVPKVLHKILGRPIISYVLDAVGDAGISKTVTVAGFGIDRLKELLGEETKVVIQRKLLGSGDAVKTAKRVLGKHPGDILVICGDTPLIKPRTIKDIIERHKAAGASATLLTVRLKDPAGYGRIIRSNAGKIVKIMEEEDAHSYGEVVNEINVGTYCFKAKDLFEALSGIRPNNRKKEFFLTDVIEILGKKGLPVEAVSAKDASEMIGINTRKDLAVATATVKSRILNELMDAGVTIEDPLSTVIYPGAKIGRDTVIYANTYIESDVEIGASCLIGPFTRLRKGVRIGNRVEVGNFVELVRTEVGDDTKVKHHTYLGDTKLGKSANIGAGVITANYDGKNKNRTIIEDGAFIGVGARLIAPLSIGKGAVVGAGAVVPKNHDVPKGATVLGVPARILKKRLHNVT